MVAAMKVSDIFSDFHCLGHHEAVPTTTCTGQLGPRRLLREQSLHLRCLVLSTTTRLPIKEVHNEDDYQDCLALHCSHHCGWRHVLHHATVVVPMLTATTAAAGAATN